MVTGLTAADFHVYEDDQEQTIDRLIAVSAPFSVAVPFNTQTDAGRPLGFAEPDNHRAAAVDRAVRPVRQAAALERGDRGGPG